jgi:hypothetical protein
MSIRHGHANIDREALAADRTLSQPTPGRPLEPLFHQTGSLATDRHQSRPVALVEGHRL